MLHSGKRIDLTDIQIARKGSIFFSFRQMFFLNGQPQMYVAAPSTPWFSANYS